MHGRMGILKKLQYLWSVQANLYLQAALTSFTSSSFYSRDHSPTPVLSIHNLCSDFIFYPQLRNCLVQSKKYSGMTCRLSRCRNSIIRVQPRCSTLQTPLAVQMVIRQLCTYCVCRGGRKGVS